MKSHNLNYLSRLAGSIFLIGTLSTFATWAEDTPPIVGGVPMNLNLFGANQLNANYDDLMNKSSYHAFVKALNIWNLRYVGGSPASYWNWTGSYIPEEEITAIWPYAWFVLNGANDYVNAWPDSKWSPSTMINCANSADVGNVQWLCNLTTRPDDQPAFIDHLKNTKGYNVRNVEMDNETYFWGAVFGGISGGQKYADRVNTLSPTVRSLYPDAKVGIVADETMMWQSDTATGNSRRDNWNNNLWNSQNRTNYDAFVLHHYDMHADTLNDFADLSTVKSAYLCFPQITMQRAANRMESMYGDRPIWVTEYNVWNGEDNSTPASQFVSNARQTAWNAFYQAGFILTAMNQPEDYTVLNVHSILGGSWGFGEKASTSSGKINPCGHIFSQLAYHARKSQTMYGLEPDSNPSLGFTYDGNSSMKAFLAAAVRSVDEATLFIMNRDNQAHTFSMSQVFPLTGYQQVDAYIYDAEDSNGSTMTTVSLNSTPIWQQAGAPLTPATISTAINPNAGLSINIPAYSLAMVTLTDPILIEPQIDSMNVTNLSIDLGISQLPLYGLTTAVQRATSLTPVNWSNAATFAGTVSATNWSDSILPTDTNVFYRLQTTVPAE